ncbi:MAG: 4Fe-4S dicluster domain-containing protein [SAR324 cluster bacterium]|nr:4Fe-4S dicluster domain-containing protein [SAR324 cluster bacterium]MBL7034305.1 4Fe-4S dicluster domain-containing protein [SAR324 cluster bacterium]
MSEKNNPAKTVETPENSDVSRRELFKKTAIAGTIAAAGAVSTTIAASNVESGGLSDALDEFFQKHYQEMSKEEMQKAIARLERKAKEKHGKEIHIGNTPPLEGVLFGYALNISKCKGYRKCVDACVAENNQNRDTTIQYIRVLELENESMNFEEADHYYDRETVPHTGKKYFPIQCQQCENPPCVTACPVEATWKEADGITVIDYNWCIGCRYCAAACPYWARKFNWSEPSIPEEKINPETHYLSNRPRMRGVMEKCTFCLQRTRKGKLPACLEACPTGARVFGNILDPKSEIRYVLENKKVFRLKEELNTEPKFWYYSD